MINRGISKKIDGILLIYYLNGIFLLLQNIGMYEYNMEYLCKVMDVVKEMEDNKESFEVGSILECGR